MVMGGVNAWGQTVISTFSMPTENPTPAWGGGTNGNIGDDAYALGSNNGVSYFAQGLKDKVTNQETGVTTRNFVKKDNGYKLQADDIETAHFKLQFAAGHVKAGDILTIGANQVYNTAGDIKFKVGGSNVVETGTYTANGPLVEITHTIQANEIITDGDNEYIRLGRCSWPDNSIGFATFKITRPAIGEGYTVTFSGINGGNVTAKRNDTDASIVSGSKVPDGTRVTFTATPNGDNLCWVWNLDGRAEYSWDPQTITVNKDITVTHEFGSVYVNVYTNNANYGTVNIAHGSQNATSFHVTPWAGKFTLTATPTANGIFMGWYEDADHTQKIDEADETYEINNPSGTNNYFAYFVEDAKKIAKPGCGGVMMDLSNLNVGGSATFDKEAKTVTLGSTGGYVSFKFDVACSFTDLIKWVISADKPANISNISFWKNGEIIKRTSDQKAMQFYTGATNRTLEEEYKTVLTSVDEIRIAMVENTTTTIETIYFEIAHGPRPKPTLANPTTEEMRIFSDETLQLRITNNAGFWREYTNDTYETTTFTHIGHDANGQSEWKPSYDISGLGVGDYYFGIKDGGNCAENDKYHESDLVKVHVKVEEAIKALEVNGTKRSYDLYIPEGLTSSSTDKVGVVLSLHRKDYDFDNGRVDFNPVADENKNIEGKKFVVAYPRALVRDGHRNWQLDESSTDDTEFFKAIVKKINDEDNGLTVDYSRIYLAGYSDGGAMAFKVAHKDADFYAAIASVSGVPYDDSHLWHGGKKPVPFLFIQGGDDGIFRDQIGTTNVTTIAHNMMYRNGAAFTATDGTITINNNDVVKDCHEAEAGGAAFYHYTVPLMHHMSEWDWDNDEKDDVAPTMWAFFNKNDKVNSLDETLKFRVNDPTNFWANAGNYGFENVNTGTSVLAYGGATKTNENKNIYHSLQFVGNGSGTPHYVKLNMSTDDVGGAQNEQKTDYFLVTLTKVGDANPVFAKRYQAGRGTKDLYINFNAAPGVNEYKLTVTKSRSELTVSVNCVEFHSGMCEDLGSGITENPVYFFDTRTILEGMKPIYQPVYGQSYDGLAKEYLPLANIPAQDKITLSDALKVGGAAKASIEKSTTIENNKLYINLATSGQTGEKTDIKGKNAVILGGTEYIFNETNGIQISQYGRAMMPEYINGTVGDFPTHGVIAMQLQGTLDFTVLAHNVNTTDANRRMLKVYYTNDQLDGELKQLKEWDFFGTRNELGNSYGQQLQTGVRLQHLGKDGTCVVFITYEGRKVNSSLEQHDEDNDDVWIKGIIIKRPDLKVTIGRTDKLRYEDGNPIHGENDKLTCFGENKPYQWNLGTSGFRNTKKTDIEEKKVNMNDGRTYICGVGPNGEELIDHILVYSDGQGLTKDDKAQFDGRPSNGKHAGYEDDETDNNEHIEFRHPTKYSGVNASGANQTGFDGDRRSFTPILSDGLKVNVTGSGWFTIACSAPNGPVNMKVLSSTNGGVTYINLLREFRVEKSSSDTDWKTYRVYLKAHAEKDGEQGFWDGHYKEHDEAYGVEIPKLDPEDTQMSLYVVFDAIDGVNYKEANASDDAQLNIHFLQWINEMPADYVFQREENPALLNSLQKIVGNGTNENPDLYWQAGTSLVEGKTTVTPKRISTSEPLTSDSAYDSVNQQDRPDGQDSGWGTISKELGCKWDVAAEAFTVAHTEVDYANVNTNYAGFNHEYSLTQANSESADDSHKNLEFAIPISGSFFRFMPMKNQFISAWIVPTDNAKIFILDETGKPIPFLSGADTNGEANKAKITPEGRIHGWVHAVAGLNYDEGNKCFTSVTGSPAVRIDFAALAGKEYFIVSNNSKIALARLKASGNSWRANMEEISTALTLTDGADNTTAITASMAGTGRYATSVTLNRTFAAGKWASLVLPFSMNEQKVKEVFGDDAICIHFTDVDTETNTVKLTHHFYNMIVAGRPVFIRPSKNVTNPEITDVTLQTNVVTNTTTPQGFKFFASYNNSTMKNNDFYMNNNNQIKYLKVDAGSTSYPGMRSFIQSPEGYDPTKVAVQTKALFLNFDDMDTDVPTGIEEIITSEFGENVVVMTKSTKVYDLLGNVVAEGEDINNLPAGIYIVNGKKYVVK